MTIAQPSVSHEAITQEILDTATTTNPEILDWVVKSAELLKPSAVHWCTGSQE